MAPGTDLDLSFELTAVVGLKEATLVGAGGTSETQGFDGAPQEARASFTVTPEEDGWYALSVEDAQGRFAYTDPLWIEAVALEDVLPEETAAP